MSYIRFIILYDILDSTRFDMDMFLEKKMKVFDTLEETFEEIDNFTENYNHLMIHINKDKTFTIEKSEDDCELHFKTNDFCVVGQTIDKEFRIVIKKVYTD